MKGPTFKHGCPCCTFLGSHEHDAQSYDLYYCKRQVVARFGDESGAFHGYRVDSLLLPYFLETVPAVAEAYKRAQHARLI
jgi:hypothetical protein